MIQNSVSKYNFKRRIKLNIDIQNLEKLVNRYIYDLSVVLIDIKESN